MSRGPDDNLIGESPEFLEVLEAASEVAALNRPALVIGERGTGKELIASRIHFLSQRWDEPFIQLNCAALNESLLESELFGHEAGAFTGAKAQRKGRFELAHKGTLFLDELSNTSMSVQEKILRVIEYGEFERVGGQTPVRVDVRIVAATNEDLPSLVDEGRFRADLLDRLAFDVITLPPLRARGLDIMELAEHFARRMTSEMGRDVFAGFSDSATKELMDYRWPGNVRELKNVVERAVYRNKDADSALDGVTFDPFESPYRPKAQGAESSANADTPTVPDQPFDFKTLVSDYEIALLKSGLKQAKYNQKKAAEILGLTYHQLRGQLRKYELLDSSE